MIQGSLGGSEVKSAAQPAGSHATLRETLQDVARRIFLGGLLWPEVCSEFEKICIVEALSMAGGSVQGAAEIMGIHRNTLSKKIREHGIDRSLFKMK